jgi:hypothetical protein
VCPADLNYSVFLFWWDYERDLCPWLCFHYHCFPERKLRIRTWVMWLKESLSRKDFFLALKVHLRASVQ